MPDDFDFDAALAAAVAREDNPAEEAEPTPEEESPENVEEPEPDESEPEVEVEASEEEEPEGEERPRDERGRFVSKAEEDPIVQQYLAQFGGDVEEAVKAAAHQTSLIGRQGAELGELRQLVQSLQTRVEAPPPQVVPPGALEDEIEENPAAVAQWALENAQAGVYEEAMGAWYEIDPRGASRFERALEMEIIRGEVAKASAPIQQSVEQQRQEAAARDLQTQYPDFGEVLGSATQEELTGLNQDVVRQLQQQDPKAALEMVYRWVKSGRPAPSAPSATLPPEEARAAKREAAVVSGTSQPARGDKSTIELLKESMLSPDPFSVRDGLQGF